MSHLLFLYFILVYTVGLGALIAIITVYVRTRSDAVLAYVVFYVAFTLKVAVTALDVYSGVNLQYASILVPLRSVDSWVTLFFAVTIAALVRRLFRSAILRYFEWGFIAAAVALLVYGAFPGTAGMESAYVLLAAASLHSLVVCAACLKETRLFLRGAARIHLVGLAVFLPLIFVPLFVPARLTAFLGNVELQLLTFPLFYCYQGILFARYFIRQDGGGAQAPRLTPSLEDHGLSDREQEVAQLVATGASNREIGERLFISVPTVKKHVHNACGKLGLSTRYQLIRLVNARRPPK